MISQISKSAAFVFLLIMPAYAYAEDEATAKAQRRMGERSATHRFWSVLIDNGLSSLMQL
jgi:hypothetical protein